MYRILRVVASLVALAMSTGIHAVRLNHPYHSHGLRAPARLVPRAYLDALADPRPSLARRAPVPIGRDAIKPGATATCHAAKSAQALDISFATDYTVTMAGWGEVADRCGGGLLDNLRGDCKGSAITNWQCAIDGAGNAVATWRMPKVNVYNCVENAIYHASWNKVGGVKCDGVNNVADAIGTGTSVVQLLGESAGGKKGL